MSPEERARMTNSCGCMSYEQAREMANQFRRLLIAMVGEIEKAFSIEPAPPRFCAGCTACEKMHRQTLDVRYTVRNRAGPPGRAPNN